MTAATGSAPYRFVVPLAHARRQELLIQRWRKAGPYVPHMSSVRLPREHTTGYYRCWADYSLVGDIAVSEQYSDALEGISGRPAAGWNVVVHIMREGGLRLTGEGRTVQVRPGMLCVRDTRVPWEFAYEPGSRMQVLILPFPALADTGLARLPPIALVSQETAEARLLLGQLRLIREMSAQLSPAGVHASRQTILELLAGVLGAGTDPAGPAFGSSLCAAARDCAESRLLDPDLDPGEVARALGVSVRTLHRAFADTEESLMAYVRRRRLERARDELTVQGGRARTVSEVAARWNFADASHFSRAFKRRFGEAPGTLARAARVPAVNPPR